MLSDLAFRLRALLRRGRIESELDAELRFHLAKLTEQLERAGCTPDEARRRAAIEIGGLEQTREACREARGVSFVDNVLQDTGYACRLFVKAPAFSAAVVLSLALGIGANTAVFTLANALMWRPVEAGEPSGLWLVRWGREYAFTYQQFQSFQRHNEVMNDLAAYSATRLNVTIDGSIEPAAAGQLVSGTYFVTLRVAPAIGRVIGPQDDVVPNGHPVAVISDDYWRRRFDRSPAVVGRTVALSGTPFTIVGVTPPGFRGIEVGTSPDIFVPLLMQRTVMPTHEDLLADQPGQFLTWLRVFGRLEPGIASEEAAARLQPLFVGAIPPDRKLDPIRRERLTIDPGATGVSDLREPFSESLFILLAIVAVALLIACANIANLLLARAAARRSEFAMRLALGAGRRRLVGQLVIESLVLAAAGGACGLVLAQWSAHVLVDFISSSGSPASLNLTPDLRVLAFTGAVSILTALLFGLAPALRTLDADLSQVLNGAGRTLVSRSRLRVDKTLAIVQVALALTLVTGAGLFAQSLVHLQARGADAPRDRVLIVRVEPKGSDQRNVPGASDRLDRTYGELIQQVAASPGVEAASMAQLTPTLIRGLSQTVVAPPDVNVQTLVTMVYPNYFAVLALPIVAGRDFGQRDLSAHAAPVAVVNETFARKVFGRTEIVGRHVKLGSDPSLREIVGVVKDSPYVNFRRDVSPVTYQPFLQTQTGRGQMALYVRVRGGAAAVIPEIRRAVHRLDPTLPMFETRTLGEELDAVLVRERLVALLSSAFGVLALGLACLGLYGLFAFAVTERTAEIGVRVALGARRHDVIRLVMREALILVAAGTSIGLLVAFATTRFASAQMSVLLFDLAPTDPVTIAGSAVVLAVVASAASYVPARRAARVEPIVALRIQ